MDKVIPTNGTKAEDIKYANTVKKVYIDGVDVSGCEFSCENPLHEIKHSCNVRGYEKDNGLHIHLQCKNNPNCYYKQLKRLEQENERLKARLRPLEDSYFNGLSSIEIAELAKKSIRITAENRKLEYALQEIKGIAEDRTKTEDYLLGQEYTDLVDKIIAKINEVIGEK